VSLRVIIAGGGVGGLCLAQGLRKQGIDVTVYERDVSATARGQGYRLRIDRHGTGALRACLPEDLFDLYQATSSAPYLSVGRIYDDQLKLHYTHADPTRTIDPETAARGVNRLTLRQVMLAGLEDRVRFGAAVTGFETTEDGVRVRLSDGRVDMADLLVGADGLGSAIRRGLAPDAVVLDTGLRAIYGMTPLDDYLTTALPSEFFSGTSLIQGPGRQTIALGSYRSVLEQQEAVRRYAPYAHVDSVADYLKWVMVAPLEVFPFTEEEFWAAPPRRLAALAREFILGWHPELGELVRRGVPEVTTPIAIRAAASLPEWPSGPVTLIGDAIHATTPVGGTGANTALRDAAELCARLSCVSTRDQLIDAVHGYETEMRQYGEIAAVSSLRGAEKIFRCDPVGV
jgi:2-polyprenyl-6-methoxyphenol hydroxylase-like FAD-dependent oxidoreductase